jgi:hypothetical protein
LSAKQVHNEAKPIFSVAERERCGNVYSAQEQGEKQTRVGQSSSLVMMVQYFKK